MIKRIRINRSGWSISVTPKGNFLKLETGKTVRYFPLWNIFHNLKSITDKEGIEWVTHLRNRSRVTVDRMFDATDLNVEDLFRQAMGH